MTGEFRYYVFYILDAQQHKLMNVLKKHIPEDHGEAFYPCMEYYRRGDKAVKIRAIFPGYVFLYTDWNIKEVHQLIRMHRPAINSGMRELGLAERRQIDPDFLFEEEAEPFDLPDITDEEKSFIDTLREGNGLLEMSSGYEDRLYQDDKNKKPVKKWIVMEGPLRAFQDMIVEVDKHNRKAFLELEINGRQAQAGFNCFPKAYWYPSEDSRIARLDDGSEFDINELKRSIMTVSK